MGVPTQVIAVVAPLHLFAQFWYHTQHIGKMGFLENILVTPSLHRVHHAVNPEYLDKNLAAIFIIWDKWFNTYQVELDDVKPVYGITRPVQTWNPIKINFQHLWLLIQDAWRTKNIADKFTIWFKPTGWRPSDVEEKYPVDKIEDIYHFEKYNPKTSKSLQIWCWIQLIALLIFVSYLFGNIAQIGSPNMFFYGAFIFLFVYALTELMDGSRWALLFEGLKCIVGLGIIYFTGSWFGADKLFPFSTIFFIGYFIVSLGGTRVING